jgi:acyl-CoA thioesterase-2
MTTGVDISVGAVLQTLELAPAGRDAFLGSSMRLGLPRVFGGQLLAQSLLAGARTVGPTAHAHSLHLYFLRPGVLDQPIEFRVERVRDGRRLAVRTVRAVQGGRVLTTMTASFLVGGAVESAAPEHQVGAPASRAPEDLPTLAAYADAWGGLSEVWSFLAAVDCRVDPGRDGLAWLRLNEPVPDDPLLHQALLAYLSDVTTMAAVMTPHGLPIGIEQLDGHAWDGVSLDHVIWFHRDARADEWLLFSQLSPSSSGGRGLARADVYTAGGTLAASLAQEGLFVVTETR